MRSVVDAFRVLQNRHIVDVALGPIQLGVLREDHSCKSDCPAVAPCPIDSLETVEDIVKLFVGGVPPSVSHSTLADTFSPFGSLVEVHVVADRGFAFVKFQSAAEAMAAITGLHGQTLPGGQRPLEVRVADKGNSPRPACRSNGAWTEYLAPDGAPYYHHALSGATTWDPPSEFAPRPRRLPDKGPVGANVFLFGIPDVWTDADLRYNFASFGPILSAKVVGDKHTGLSRGFAFISFDAPTSAARAVEAMHGCLVNGRRIKVQLRRGEGPLMSHGG